MKLINLRLKNFKSIRDFELDTKGGNVSIFADNAVGKTTIADAFSWLMFGKDSQNKSDFEIKTLDADGQPIHNLEHEVTGSFDINSRMLILKKIYKEVWTKKRGAATAEHTGHTTDYWIDGVPSQKKEYDQMIAGIASEGLFKLLTSPTYFNQSLSWQERRKILLEVCGDISDTDVIASDIGLSPLPDILGARSLDDHKKVITAKRTEINRELDKIPVRIDEANRSLPEYDDTFPDTMAADMSAARAAESSKRAEISRLENGGEVAEKRKQLSQLQTELIDLQNQQKREKAAKTDGLWADLSQIKRDVEGLKNNIPAKNNKITERAELVKLAEKTAEEMRAEWRKIDAEKFEITQETSCPACGQNLPEDQLAAAKQKALEQFNLSKATKLANIVADGKAFTARAAEIKRQIIELQAEVDNEEELLKSKVKESIQLQSQINAFDAVEAVTPEMSDLRFRVEALESDITKLNTGSESGIEKAKEELADIQQQIRTVEDAQGRARQHKEGQARIIELTKQQKALAAEYERLEHELYLCDQFVRAKVALLTDRINGKFKYARFRLFSQQINGGISECCETTINGIPYEGALNNGARVNAGLDIINTLANHYGFDAPIFCDNAESVTELIPTEGQLIRLVVSAADKKLRIVTEEN